MTLLYQLITPQEFISLSKQATDSKRVIPVDATWYLPNLNRDGRQEFLQDERIPGAVYFDIDAIKDVDSPFPHMAPTVPIFKEAMGQTLGLLPSDTLVVYDRIGNFSAPRVAWTLGLLGHADIRLMNSFQVYKEIGGELEHNSVKSLSPYEPKEYTINEEVAAKNIQSEVVPFETMMDDVDKKTFAQGKIQLFDARSFGRYRGVDPEPRPGMTSGHVPGAQALPFVDVLDPETKQFPSDQKVLKGMIIDAVTKYNRGKKARDQVQQELETRPIVCMCGTGVTGTIIKTAFEYAGYPNVKLYDGSWTQWALTHGNESGLIERDL